MAELTQQPFSKQPQERWDLYIGLAGTFLLGAIVFVFQSPLFLVGLIALIALAVGVFFWHDVFPLTLVVILPFSLELQVASSTRLTIPTEPFIILIFLLFIAKTVLTGKFAYRRSMMNIGVGLMYLVITGSLLVTHELESSLKAVIRDTGYILAGYYLIPLCINSEERLQRFCKASLVTYTLIVIYGFITQAVGGLKIYDEIAAPFFIEHCIYAAFITIAFCFVLAFLLDAERGSQRRFYLGVAASLIGAAILTTFVRAAWISVIFVLFYYLYQFRGKRSSVDLIAVLLIVALSGVGVLLLTDLGKLFLQRIETVTDFKYVSNYDRIDRWTAAWNMWLGNMVFGVGWGAYPDLYEFYREYENAYSSGIRMGAHNLYLEIMAETGFIGILVFLFMIFVFYRECILLQYHVRSRFIRVFLIGMQGSMLTLLIHAFLNNLGPSDKISLIFWGLFGMVTAIGYLAEKEEEAA